MACFQFASPHIRQCRGLKEIRVEDWGRLSFEEALGRQKRMVAERIADCRPDSLAIVEHPPTVTIGRSGSLKDLHVDRQVLKERNIALHHVDRGGRATFHGPGQLVAYPVVRVGDKDLHAFLKRLLDVVAEVLRSYRLVPEFKEARPGVWVNGAKIASVGLAVRKWVTYHGVALNVSTPPGWFDLIVPCGMPDEQITSMEREAGVSVDMEEAKERFVASFCALHGYLPPQKEKIQAGERPRWLVKEAADLKAANRMESRLSHLRLATVCQSARCPNLGECFSRGTATFMILGTRCTRRCRFCAVDKRAPGPVDGEEPARVAEAVRLMGITHAVVTSVTRDDLPDGGAGHFVETIRQIRTKCPDVSVEVLTPDFAGSVPAVEAVCRARPDVFNHNVETVPRLYARIRPLAKYRRSLAVLSYAASKGLAAKSGLMLGLGETGKEIGQTMADLKSAGCSLLTLGQYLAPSQKHAPVARYVPPEEFAMWADIARSMGFASVASGPLVRSSYRADQMLAAGRLSHRTKRKRSISWEAKDSSWNSEQARTFTGRTSPRPHAGP